MDTLKSVNAKTRRAFNLAAQKYDEFFGDELDQKPYDRRRLDEFAARFGAGALILDAGCGPSGHIGRYVFDKGIPVVGVDISDRCVESARLRNPAMRFECGDIGALDFEAAAFDGIIAFYSILDTPKRFVGRLFHEFRRVLKPGGLLLTAAKAGGSEGYLDDILGHKAEIYFSLFSTEEIRSFYTNAGFVLEFLETRKPYGQEIDVERIYALGRKE
jgi:SAM-dependent methyltransferase